MALPDNTVQREYINEAQLMVTAPDQATAQAALEAAMTALRPLLAGLPTPVTLMPEVENGIWVLSEQG